MRKAKVISYTKPKSLRGRSILYLLPFLIIISLRLALVLTPFVIGGYYIYQYGIPHMLWEYEYYGSKEHPHITSCTYIGIYGAHTFPAEKCPIIQLMKPS